MKRICGITASLTFCALSAVAQPEPPKAAARLEEMKSEIEKMLVNPRILGVEGAVMGATVKGAPYSADELRETTQVLGDGTRIHNESKVTVYRDGEGRIRRETPTDVTIWDPVSGTTYLLDPKSLTYRKMQVHMAVRNGDPGTGVVSTYMFSSGSELGEFHDPPRLEIGSRTIAGSGGVGGGIFTAGPGISAWGADAGYFQRLAIARPAKKESLGNRLLEGVNSDGERSTTTIEAGAIGNDRPISSVSERWYSSELQVNMMTLRSDPRSGEESFKLTNIRRSEPDATLFQVPLAYQPAGPTKL
jgi:hypothetical protein